ncbi:serine hydrolase [Bifidobacterium ramosum]|uniref:Serine hydrolase n=1 Tax=Bifidobacterium ramosum TaxID=1798158 RepID=A0A6L4X2U4_9BIFI|nr:serine hydrolase [Bifidobacterium ramosum]KAB8289104.1 serine hydrolase [Bifidobacterium ramosum]NEG70817.1 serine hydrolase [Bifidobacterium ramosum]
MDETAHIADLIATRTQERHLNVYYIQTRRAGKITADLHRLPRKTRLNMYSVSKSVTSIGVGLAIQEGLTELDEHICDALPEYVPDNPSTNLQAVTVRDLLTMSSGLRDPLFFSEDENRYRVHDWISYFFHADFVNQPGTRFLYSNFNTYIASCIVERRAGQNLLNYLRNRLFEPLGIGNPDWTLCPQGHVHAANGLYLTIDELGNFGQMLCQNGVFNGLHLVDERYVRDATTKHIDTDPDHKEKASHSYGYGYQFWMAPWPGAFLCDGRYGQYCLVIPNQETVVSIMSMDPNYGEIRDIMLDSTAEALAI